MAVVLKYFARARGFGVLKGVKEGLIGPKVNGGVSGLISARTIYVPAKDPKDDLISEIDLNKLPEYEIVKDPEEWKYVERLFSLKTVPPLKETSGPFPSGFIPPNEEEARKYPYFIKRTKNHMLPVYLKINFRGTRHITVVKKIEGNIWELEKDLKKYLEEKLNNKYTKVIPSKINEFVGSIKFRGDHVSYVKKWMELRGF